MDELMRHQPSLRADATKAIIKVSGLHYSLEIVNRTTCHLLNELVLVFKSFLHV